MNSTEIYCSSHNVTNHRNFNSREESLNYLAWRNRQYVYLEKYLLKNSELEGKILLDYGCGPGNDLVWAIERGAEVIGMDVSKSSLNEAKDRLKFHGNNFKLIHKNTNQKFLIEDESVDIITSYGVLHHIGDISETLSEFKRVLKPDGEIHIMVYNKNSLWWHLYVASILAFPIKNLNYRDKIKNKIIKSFETFEHSEPNLKEIFRTSTEGPNCPVSECYTPDEFLRIMEKHSFTGEFLGSAISLHELTQVKHIYAALCDERLNQESADFLQNLTYDNQNIPLFGQHVAGINAHYKFKISK